MAEIGLPGIDENTSGTIRAPNAQTGRALRKRRINGGIVKFLKMTKGIILGR
jgi:hypothetical protein